MPSDKVAPAQHRVKDLELEIDRLRSEIDLLTGQEEAADQALDQALARSVRAGQRSTALQAATQRGPSKEAEVAERAARIVAFDLRGKRAALKAAEVELLDARAGLAAAERGAAVAEVEERIDRLAELAAEIDRSPLDPELWRRLIDQIVAVNQAYVNRQLPLSPGHAGLIDSGQAIRKRYLSDLVVAFKEFRPPPAVSARIDLRYARGQIAQLSAPEAVREPAATVL